MIQARHTGWHRAAAARNATATLIAAVYAAAWSLPAAADVQRPAVRDASVVTQQQQKSTDSKRTPGDLPSADVVDIAHWAVASADNRGLPFLVVDKINARLFAFSARGHPLGATPVLLGSAPGDHSVPGIGEREISQIRPHERTTPAGRFVAERGRNLTGEDIVWVDYDAAVSLHRVRNQVAQERRLERLASPTAADNRITYGCINVPARFYDTVIGAVFMSSSAIVYVLPETQPARALFGAYTASPESIARPGP